MRVCACACMSCSRSCVVCVCVCVRVLRVCCVHVRMRVRAWCEHGAPHVFVALLVGPLPSLGLGYSMCCTPRRTMNLVGPTTVDRTIRWGW